MRAVVVTAGVSLEHVTRIAEQQGLQVVPVQLMVDVDVDHGVPPAGGGRSETPGRGRSPLTSPPPADDGRRV